MKEKGEIANKEILYELITLNLKYVNKYSEFIANSFSLVWSNYINKNKDNLDKVYKNIEKISVIENKKKIYELDKVILTDNLLLINKYIKETKLKSLKNMMSEIQKINSFSDLLKYYIDLYSKEDFVKHKNKDKKINELELMVKEIKLKVDDSNLIENREIIYSKDSKGVYYTHIKFIDRRKELILSSFEEEKQKYQDSLKSKEEIFLENSEYKYSSFERKRRIYVKSMFDVDLNLCSLIDKKMDIMYPVYKVFICAKEIVDIIYRECIDIQPLDSVLNNLMHLTIDSYGSKNKIILYKELVDKFDEELNHLDKYEFDEIVRNSKEMIDDVKYSDFKLISGFIPSIDDLYRVANDKIKIYIRKNISFIVNNLECLDYYLEYMNLFDVLEVYSVIKDDLIGLRVSTVKYKVLQKKIVELIKNKFSVKENVIYNELLNEDRIK